MNHNELVIAEKIVMTAIKLSFYPLPKLQKRSVTSINQLSVLDIDKKVTKIKEVKEIL
jgi:hypothetical protein